VPQNKNPIPVPFPMGGINENNPYAGQAGVVIARCDHVLNMRPFDSLERRQRGGQRTGISKYIADAVSSSDPIQNINSVVEAFDPTAIIADSTPFTRNFNDTSVSLGELDVVDPGVWETYYGNNNFFARSESTTESTQVNAAGGGSSRSMQRNSVGANNSGAALYAGPSITIGTKYIINAKAELIGSPSLTVIYFRVPSSPDINSTFFSILLSISGSDILVRPVRHDPATTVLTVDTGSTTFASPPGGVGAAQDYSLEVSGNLFTMKANGSTLWTVTATQYSSNVGIAWGTFEGGGSRGNVLDLSLQIGVTPSSLRSTKLIVVAGGNVFQGTKASGLTSPTGGTGAMKGSGILRSQAAFQDVFLADGLSANYQYLDLGTDAVLDWATAVTAGSLPAGTIDTTIGCRIIALYRGRIAMSGLSEEPENWFLSASGDPFDWDYSPAVTSATQAVAGNASDVGVLGDIVTALIPHQDDLMFMGGDHTLWVMRGDPAAGGEIDSISRQIGVVGPEAWTWDTGSTLYFLGQNGLYRMSPGSGAPELISSKKMDRVFSSIDFQNNAIFLEYDREWQGVHIFIVPQNEPTSSGDHYWWDQRTDSWWRDQYPTSVGPTYTHLFDADKEDDRALILGGYDSFLRSFDASVSNDDGTAIDSFVRFPILHPSMPQAQFQMDDLQMNLDSGGGASCALDIYRGTTPREAAVSTTSLFTKTLVAGRNLPIRKRLRANALQFRIRNNTAGETWAFENGTVMVAGVGRQRQGL